MLINMNIYLNNQLLGNFGSPKTLNAIDLSTAQHIDLNAGWSWTSLNLASDNMTVTNALSYLDPASGDQIVSFNEGLFAAYSMNEESWVGDLDSLTNESMYQLYLAEQDELTFVGLEVNPDSVAIDYLLGWNWIGYLPTTPVAINVALGTIGTDGDYVKGQGGYADYYDSFGWWGTLDNLTPYQAYMLDVANPDILVYPDGGLARNINNSELHSSNDSELNSLDFNYKDYEFNGSITAAININDIVISESDMLIAYAGNECRGYISPLSFPLTE